MAAQAFQLIPLEKITTNKQTQQKKKQQKTNKTTKAKQNIPHCGQQAPKGMTYLQFVYGKGVHFTLLQES